MIRADECSDVNDRLLLESQRAADRDDWGACVAAADEVLKNDPLRAEAMFLAGCAMRKAGQEGVAAQLFRATAAREPKRAAPLLQLAMCLQERRPEEAYQAALRANAIQPDTPDGLSLLCNTASVLGRHAEALDWAERCEAKHGVLREVAHNKSFALFALGRWAEAWREFKPSYGMPDRKKRNYHSGRETPRWNPGKHENATVVIHGEQGIGDEIMYASMIPAAIEAAVAKGSRVVIECYARNEGLFKRSFDVPVYGTLHEAYSEWPADEGVTHRIEMGGLGEYFATEPFRRDCFLRADPARGAAWREWLRASEPAAARNYGGRDLRNHARGNAVLSVYDQAREHRAAPAVVGGRARIGLAWTGGSWDTGRARRSVPFEDVLQLIRGQDATFVCLEYEDRRKDLEFAPQVLNPHWATRKGQDMDDLAALVANLDLVISVQTSVVDLCGALGVPCWALADENPQWRYTGFFGDDTMGFYESVKVYRQKRWGDWKPVINQVARDLKAWTEARAPQAVAAE